MLVFSPELCGERDALEVLMSIVSEIDIVQVRPKPAALALQSGLKSEPACEARATYEWTSRVLDAFSGLGSAPLVLVNDRVDVALALHERGCAGVHLGQADLPPRAARDVLGEAPLIGLSTHDVRQVVQANEAPVDYLGFGPIFATSTKGYATGVGPEACWVAMTGSELPIFAIGGIDVSNVTELQTPSRVAVGGALLGAGDPLGAARVLRSALG